MSFETGYVSDRKFVYLHSVSPIAILPAAGLEIGLVIRCADGQGGYGVDSGALGFLAWLRLWFLWLSGGEVPVAQLPECNWTMNRQSARMQKCSISSARSYASFYTLCRRGLSRGQFTERLCALSLFGRVQIYGIYFWGSVLRRRAQLVCYDHGWWRTPLGVFGDLYSGFWFAHLWPCGGTYAEIYNH